MATTLFKTFSKSMNIVNDWDMVPDNKLTYVYEYILIKREVFEFFLCCVVNRKG